MPGSHQQTLVGEVSQGNISDGRVVVMRQREGKPGGGKGPLLSEESLTLATANDQTIFQPVNFDEYNATGGDEVHHAIRAGTKQSTGVGQPIVSDTIGTIGTTWGAKNYSNIQEVTQGSLVPYGFSHTQGLDAQPSEEAFPTLRREGSGHAVAQPFVKAGRAQSSTDAETWADGEVSPALTTYDNTGPVRATVTVATPYAVRRLLPIECERLMGWPDDWTRWDADGKEQADSHRYKQCGNGVASPVAEWVGRHIFAADAIGRAR